MGQYSALVTRAYRLVEEPQLSDDYRWNVGIVYQLIRVKRGDAVDAPEVHLPVCSAAEGIVVELIALQTVIAGVVTELLRLWLKTAQPLIGTYPEFAVRVLQCSVNHIVG